jgi:formylglycine-generating enzyme required for sulfatase activity
MKKIMLPLFACLFFLFITACAKPVPKDMVLIPGGTFTMGSSESDSDFLDWEGPRHEVTLNAFYMGKYTVTQKEYETIMGNNPSQSQVPAMPVESISWYNALEYCNARSKRERLKPVYAINGDSVLWETGANGYRLPTEAEWEYACRAGTNTRYNTGDTISPAQARFHAETPVEAGSFPPNAWGLYDMHGNVYEWCWDRYGDYSAEPEINPLGPEFGSRRIIRGGSAASDARHLRSSERGRVEPGVRNINLGFRVIRNVK